MLIRPTLNHHHATLGRHAQCCFLSRTLKTEQELKYISKQMFILKYLVVSFLEHVSTATSPAPCPQPESVIGRCYVFCALKRSTSTIIQITAVKDFPFSNPF